MARASSLNLTGCLGPSEVGVAACAYQAALQATAERTAGEAPPPGLRQMLARSVIEPALRGERDPDRLRDAALNRLRLLAR